MKRRNLKNFNHWIAQLREIAKLNGVQRINEDTGEPELIPDEGIRILFSKRAFDDDFKGGFTPQDAFENEMDNWADNI